MIAKREADGTPKYYHYDGSGNVRAISDASGAVVECYDYEAFGGMRNTPTGITNDRRFSAEQYDSESGYIYLRDRYYDARIVGTGLIIKLLRRAPREAASFDPCPGRVAAGHFGFRHWRPSHSFLS